MRKIIIALVIINFLCPPATAMIKTPNLVGAWRFEGNANDWSGNGNNGTVYNATLTTAGKFGQAYNFDGDGDYVDIANEANFDFERTSPYSITAWIKTSSATNQIIADKMLGASPWTGYCFFTGSGVVAGTLYIQMYGSSTSNGINKRTVETINDGNWHFVVMTYDGSSTAAGAKIYKDGIECTYTTLLDTSSTSILNNVALYIGIGHNSGYPFNGLIDEVRIYNRALTESEIRQDMLGYAPKEF